MAIAKLNRTAGIPLKYANRHGIVTGATGTGKTVSLMRMVEEFADQGVPCFVADVKGDIAALSRSTDADFIDLFGKAGRSINVTFDAMGADLTSRALDLTDSQAGALEVTFAVARDRGLPLNNISDLRAAIGEVMQDRETISVVYGQISGASIGVIQRALLRMQGEGADLFFGTPQFDVADFFKPGRVSILAADKLIQSPRVYAAFLLWMLADLYDRLPEVGDQEAPGLAFFFDEAHLIFDGIAPHLLRRIEQTVRLIRSKGVGVYFVSQSPRDIPPLIAEQCAHRIEHDKALPIGTARVETLSAAGRPLALGTIKIELPRCPLGAIDDAERMPVDPAPLATVGTPWVAPAADTAAPLPEISDTALEIALHLFAWTVIVSAGVGAWLYFGSGGTWSPVVAILIGIGLASIPLGGIGLVILAALFGVFLLGPTGAAIFALLAISLAALRAATA